MTSVSKEIFIEDFSNMLRNGSAAVFAGAGLSVAAGYVNWKGLLEPLAYELNLNIDVEHDLVKVAQYHINRHNNRHDLEQRILNEFAGRQTQVTESHRILARLPISVYWTTNYDCTIERALRDAGKIVDVKFKQADLPHTVIGRDAVVYKMHGDCGSATSAVLAKEDYEKYHLTRGNFLTALSSDLLSRTFLFIGFSFSDPNMDYVLSRMYTKHDKSQKKHYCLLAKEIEIDSESPQDFAYRKAKQEFFIRDLQRYGIRVVLLDSYDDVPNVLKAIEWKFKSRNVFVSGAAHEYGAFPEQEALDFVHKLGDGLVARDNRIVTGLGLGIGSTLLDGALQHIYRVQKRALHDQIVIRPFPQGLAAEQIWPVYRSDMLDFAGIAIFMFGNKLNKEKTQVVTSDGVIKEFDIAVSKGIKVLPLGFTGYAAKQLYDRVAADFKIFYPKATGKFCKYFEDLGNESRSFDEQHKTFFDALAELENM